MKYSFKKYEFNSELEAEAIIAGLPNEIDEDGNEYPTHHHTVVKLDYLWVEEPTFDEEGNQLTEGVKSDKYSVDVLWRLPELEQDEEGNPIYPDGWNEAEIQYDESWASRNGAHTFSGWNFS